jgi:hypothetical protein
MAGDRAAPAAVGAHVARAESLDNHLQRALGVHGAEAGDVREAEPLVGNPVQGDMTAVADEGGGDAPRTGFHDGWVRRAEARGVGGGEQQAREPLGVAEVVGGDAAQVRERVLERDRRNP